MKLGALSLAVLLCVCAAQADVVYVYDFDSLPGAADSVLNTQSAGQVTWKTAEAGNHNLITLNVVDTDKAAQAKSGISSERLTSSLNSGTSLFNLSSTVTQLQISYTAYMDQTSPWLIGIWYDVDANGTMPNSELEIPIQFGGRTGSGATRGFRVRGANGTGDTYSGTAGLDPNVWSATAANLKLVLDVNLSGDGSADLTVQNLDNGFSQKVITGAPLAFTPYPTYANPANWTGWTVRNQGSGWTINTTVDDLTLTPEPATLSVLVLGGLACLRRRR
jgi:hypothetical protein